MDFLKAQREMQQQYLDSLNELQMLRIKKEIAETNQAIAAAKLATVTAEKNISDVLTQPSPLAIANPVNPSQPSQPQVQQAQYVVISVAMQNSKWTAVLQYEGKLYSVSVGDVLADGVTVASIARDGVVLEKNGERVKLSIISSI
jgi:type IV pilus biogenesis protein PilP